MALEAGPPFDEAGQFQLDKIALNLAGAFPHAPCDRFLRKEGVAVRVPPVLDELNKNVELHRAYAEPPLRLQ